MLFSTLSEKKVILYCERSNKLCFMHLSQCYIVAGKLHIAVANTSVTDEG